MKYRASHSHSGIWQLIIRNAQVTSSTQVTSWLYHKISNTFNDQNNPPSLSLSVSARAPLDWNHSRGQMDAVTVLQMGPISSRVCRDRHTGRQKKSWLTQIWGKWWGEVNGQRHVQPPPSSGKWWEHDEVKPIFGLMIENNSYTDNWH